MKKIILFSLIIALCGCQAQEYYKDKQVLMGTFVEVTSSDETAAGIAFAEIRRIENLLSKYNPDSEISRLNKIGKLKVSPDTYYLITKAREFWLLSGGAFDPTVGPLMDLWGFSTKNYHLPKDAEIKATLNLVGFDKINLNDQEFVVEFKLPGMKIDLGAIAKGYAVDCAIKKIKEKGIKSCLISAGGDMYCLGDKSGSPWNIALQDPRGPGFIRYIALKNKAVATSGDYEQSFISNHKRYAHIFDPKSGYPVESGVASATVIASNCLTADALATTIFALGKVKAEALVKKLPDIEIEIVEKNNVQDNR